MDEIYEVWLFKSEKDYERVMRTDDPESAVMTAYFAIKRSDLVKVIITDLGDNTVWEWKRDEGVVFPPGARQQ